MDPIDFNPPNPSQQDEAELLRLRRALRSLLLWTVLGPLAWVLLAVLMTVLQQAQESESGFSLPALTEGMLEPAFQAPMRELAWNTADTLFWPVIVIVVFMFLRGALGEILIRRKFGRKDEAAAGGAMPLPHHGWQTDGTAQGQWRIMTLVMQSLRIIPMAVAGFGAIWAVMAAYAFADGRDHWEALPWVTPPYLSEFLARHPKLIVERVAKNGGKLTLRDGQGRSMRLHGSELAGAEARFEPCPRQLGAEQLGGIPPYPGMPCAALVHLSNTYGEQRFYLFGVAKASDGQAIHAHFARWADAHAGSGASSSSDGTETYRSAGSRDGAWHLEVESRKGGATSVVIRYRPDPTR
jgi:hypothetical protein